MGPAGACVAHLRSPGKPQPKTADRSETQSDVDRTGCSVCPPVALSAFAAPAARGAVRARRSFTGRRDDMSLAVARSRPPSTTRAPHRPPLPMFGASSLTDAAALMRLTRRSCLVTGTMAGSPVLSSEMGGDRGSLNDNNMQVCKSKWARPPLFNLAFE